MPDNKTPPASPRSPSYRYQIAQQAVANGQLLFASQADGLTRTLARFLRRERLCENLGQRRRLAKRHADLAAAVEMFRDPARGPAFQLEIQALARENSEAVANALCISKSIVILYRMCFFDVAFQLDNIDFILEHAIRPELKRGPTEGRARLRFVSKLLAYFCGLDGLEQLIPAGQLDRTKPWCSPMRLVRRLVNVAELSQLADLSEAQYPSFARDPQRFANWSDELMKRVRESLTERIPESPTQRRDWQILSKLGMGGSFE